MQEGVPSRTAFRVAERRAAHQLFDDPLALQIIGTEAAAALRSNAADAQTPVSRALRAFMAVRSRYAEDQLASAIARGVRQCVVLGAGLDTFAYRNPFPELRVFEIDHPATQAWKRSCLEYASIPIPGSVAFAPVDFSRETFETGLKLAGFDFTRPAFFSWLGVTPYLPREVVLATFERIIAMSRENGVAFDYTIPRELLAPAEKMAFDAVAARVAAAGEPFVCSFEPADLVEQLRRIGFGNVEDLGPEEINARYFQGRADGLCIPGGPARLLCARG